MLNNEKQIKKGKEAGKSDNLPIVSEDQQVQKNSMRLYIYLVSISKFQGKNKPRFFTQRDFSINKIHEVLGMHATTIKKYWRLLEENRLIVYQGPGSGVVVIEDEKLWEKKFMERKKFTAGYYEITKQNPYRIIPRETLDKIQNTYLVDENELKIYLLLANMQETFCFMESPERLFSICDLRELLGLTRHDKNNKMICRGLAWLKELGLIQYKIIERKNNLGETYGCYELEAVNYYIGKNSIENILSSADIPVLTQGIKEKILNEQNIDFSGVY